MIDLNCNLIFLHFKVKFISSETFLIIYLLELSIYIIHCGFSSSKLM